MKESSKKEQRNRRQHSKLRKSRFKEPIEQTALGIRTTKNRLTGLKGSSNGLIGSRKDYKQLPKRKRHTKSRQRTYWKVRIIMLKTKQ